MVNISSIGQLISANQQFSSGFGNSCTSYNNWIIIGAPNENNYAGNVYIYQYINNNWTYFQTLPYPPIGISSNSYFGFSCAIINNTLIISAPFYNKPDTTSTYNSSNYPTSASTYCGAVFIYTYNISSNIWIYSNMLFPYITQNGNGTTTAFGTSLAINKNIIVITNLFNNSVYIYNYYILKYLTTLIGTSGTNYGCSCAILDNNNIFIGSNKTQNNSISNAGVVYIYYYNNTSWIAGQILNSLTPVTSPNGNYGTSISISGTFLVIGAPYDNNNYGCAYVYNINTDTVTWILLNTLISPSTVINNNFGYSCENYGTMMVICAPNDTYINANIPTYKNNIINASGITAYNYPNNNYTNCGAAYVYIYNGLNWIYLKSLYSLYPNNNVSMPNFGTSCAISGNNSIIIGSPYDNQNSFGNNYGSCYVYMFNSLSKYINNSNMLVCEPLNMHSKINKPATLLMVGFGGNGGINSNLSGGGGAGGEVIFGSYNFIPNVKYTFELNYNDIYPSIIFNNIKYNNNNIFNCISGGSGGSNVGNITEYGGGGYGGSSLPFATSFGNCNVTTINTSNWISNSTSLIYPYNSIQGTSKIGGSGCGCSFVYQNIIYSTGGSNTNLNYNNLNYIISSTGSGGSANAQYGSYGITLLTYNNFVSYNNTNLISTKNMYNMSNVFNTKLRMTYLSNFIAANNNFIKPNGLIRHSMLDISYNYIINYSKIFFTNGNKYAYDNTKSYITFTNSGSFTLIYPMKISILLVAAGGRGGNRAYAGGGGAGEVDIINTSYLLPGNYSVNVGFDSVNFTDRKSYIKNNSLNIITNIVYGGQDGESDVSVINNYPPTANTTTSNIYSYANIVGSCCAVISTNNTYGNGTYGIFTSRSLTLCANAFDNNSSSLWQSTYAFDSTYKQNTNSAFTNACVHICVILPYNVFPKKISFRGNSISTMPKTFSFYKADSYIQSYDTYTGATSTVTGSLLLEYYTNIGSGIISYTTPISYNVNIAGYSKIYYFHVSAVYGTTSIITFPTEIISFNILACESNSVTLGLSGSGGGSFKDNGVYGIVNSINNNSYKTDGNIGTSEYGGKGGSATQSGGLTVTTIGPIGYTYGTGGNWGEITKSIVKSKKYGDGGDGYDTGGGLAGNGIVIIQFDN